MSQPARTRFRSVKFKNGGEVRLLPDRGNQVRGEVEQQIRNTMDGHEASYDIGGYAFVIWSKDGASTCNAANMGGRIPSMLIPDFVRNRLLVDFTISWTIDELNRQNGS